MIEMIEDESGIVQIKETEMMREREEKRGVGLEKGGRREVFPFRHNAAQSFDTILSRTLLVSPEQRSLPY